MQLLFFLIARIWFAINLSQKSGTVKGKPLAINRQLDYNKDRTQIFVGTREAMLNETALEDPSGGHTAGRSRMYSTVAGGSGEADSLKLSLYGLWIGLGLIIALVCTLLETVSDC